MALLKRIFPFLAWFEKYTTASLRLDLVSGVTVALVLIPQSMAYAQLAGLPAYYGLYAAFLPPMVAALFGSSNQLATGPVAVVSLMTSAALEPLATAGGTEYISYAILLALLVGMFQLTLGLLRLGLIVNFLSHPVVNGFTNAAALIIATSQLSKIFGVYVDSAEHHYETIYRVVLAALDYTHLPTFGMAVLAFSVMIGLRKLNPRIPNVLVAVVLTTLLSWVIGFERNRLVDSSALESERVRALIAEFNQAVLERGELEALRAEGNEALKARQSTGDEDAQVCTSCHASRELSLMREREQDSRPRSGRALIIHHVAGLLDLRIEQLKDHISNYREELRSIHFGAVKDPNGELRFVSLEELANAGEEDVGRWRIKVGAERIDEKAITMIGAGAVVATIPEGLPKLALPVVDWDVAARLSIMAMVISLLGFMEAISIAKAMAARTQQRLDPDQELIGQGLANIVGCIGQRYAVSGSFSRSAVNLQAGAVTGLSNVFSSAVVVVVLLFFTPLLYHLPQAVLASIIIMAVFGLLKIEGFVHAWKAQKFDGITGVASFVGTLIFAPHLEWGIAIGVALSLGAYLFRTMKPLVPELSLHPDGSLRDANWHQLRRCKYIGALRFDGPLNFVNTSYLEDRLLGLVAEMPDLRHMLIAAHGINEIDASGEDMLRHLVDRLREAGYEISFSGMKEEVTRVLERTGLYERIGEKNLYPTQALAVAAIHAKAHVMSTEKDCPLQPMRPRVTDVSLHPDGSLRDVSRHRLKQCKHIAAIRFHGSLDLASSNYLQERADERTRAMPELRHVLIAAHGIPQIDVHGVEMLGKLVQTMRGSDVDVSFSGFADNVLDTLKKYRVLSTIGEENIYPTQVQALKQLYAKAHKGSTEKDCPLRSMRPQVVELSLHPDGSLRDARRHLLEQCKHIAAIRFDGSYEPASSEYLEEKVLEKMANMPELKHVFIAAHRISAIDNFGAEILGALVGKVRESGFEVLFSGFSDNVLDTLKETDLYDTIGVTNMYPTQAQAVEAIHGRAHVGSNEKKCPLTTVVPLEADQRENGRNWGNE